MQALAHIPPTPPPALSLDEGVIDLALRAHAARPMARDALRCSPASVMSAGLNRPFVIAFLSDDPVVLPADTARRLAVHASARGGRGVALDLMGAADEAEALSTQLQKVMN